MKALLALERVRLLRGKSVWLGASVALLLTFTGVAARYSSGRLQAVETSLDLGFAHLLAYLLPYLFCAGMIAEEVSGRTLGFLTSRPVRRSEIVVAKWLVGSAACAGVLLGACLLLQIGSYASEPAQLVSTLPSMLTTWAALALQTSAYVAIGLFYGALLPSAASALFAFHLLFAEAALSLAPGPLRLLSLAHHGAELAGLPRHGVLSASVRPLPGFAHLGVLLALTLLALFLAATTFERSEYRESGHE